MLHRPGLGELSEITPGIPVTCRAFPVTPSPSRRIQPAECRPIPALPRSLAVGGCRVSGHSAVPGKTFTGCLRRLTSGLLASCTGRNTESPPARRNEQTHTWDCARDEGADGSGFPWMLTWNYRQALPGVLSGSARSVPGLPGQAGAQRSAGRSCNAQREAVSPLPGSDGSLIYSSLFIMPVVRRRHDIGADYFPAGSVLPDAPPDVLPDVLPAVRYAHSGRKNTRVTSGV